VVSIDNTQNVTRWIAYFDLLGIRDLLATGREHAVLDAYERAIEELGAKRAPAVRHTWFSDTFLLIAPDDSAVSFRDLDHVSRWFVYFLLRGRVPLRGAIACDRFCADFDNRVFVGRALVEAYEYGEGQDWIGLVLSPTAINRLRALGLPAEERLNYTFYDLPWKRKPPGAPDMITACILDNWARLNGRNPCVEALSKIGLTISRDAIRSKYERTIRFLEENGRLDPNR